MIDFNSYLDFLLKSVLSVLQMLFHVKIDCNVIELSPYFVLFRKGTKRHPSLAFFVRSKYIELS